MQDDTPFQHNHLAFFFSIIQHTFFDTNSNLQRFKTLYIFSSNAAEIILQFAAIDNWQLYNQGHHISIFMCFCTGVCIG